MLPDVVSLRPSDVLRVMVMASTAVLALLVFFMPRPVALVDSPAPPDDQFQDLRAVADGYRKVYLGTAENPLLLPAPPADCGLSLALPVDQPCDNADAAGTVDGGGATCALVTVRDVRWWRVDAPAGFTGTMRCALGACVSAFVKVVPDPIAPDPAIRGHYTGAMVACPKDWPGTPLP